MKTRPYALALSALALATASFAATAGVVFTNLGETAPPSTLGSHSMTPFLLAPQVAIPEFSDVTAIPAPSGGVLSFSTAMQKCTGGATWGTDAWPGAYLGPIYFTGFTVSSRTLTLPANTKAFYLYLQNNGGSSAPQTIQVTTDSGATSGPLSVTTGFRSPNVGAFGFAFHTTAGESITSITVESTQSTSFAIGNFGINGGVVTPATTCASEGYTGTKLTWCKNICEMGYTGAQLDTWIHRWINRYRDLPYCAQEGGGEEEPPPQEA